MAELTIEQLESALIKADAAGNVDDAKVLAAELIRRKSTPAPIPRDEIVEPTAEQQMMFMPDEFTGEATPEAKVFIPGMLRELGEGATLGASGEIKGGIAGLRAMARGEPFLPAAKKEMGEYEARRKAFKEQYPYSALGAEIAGSIPTALLSGGAAATTRLGQAAPRATQAGLATLEGGAYGLLGTEGGIEDRALGGAIGLTGAGLLGAGGQFLPRVTEPAKRLIKEKIQPTIGQAFGPTIKALEERATSIPLIGDVIRAGQREVIQSFDNKMIEKALAPIGFKVPAGKTGVQAMEAAEDALSEAYRKAIPKAGLPNARPLQSRINEIVQENTDLPKDIFDQLRKKLNKTIAPSLFDEGYKMSGEAIKKADSYLGKEAIGYIRTGDPDKQQMGRALFKMQSALRDELISQNPSAKGLSSAREAYKQILPIRKAATAAPADVGTFTPAQLLRGMKSADVSVGKTRFATGKMPEQELAMTAQEVLGKRIPDSGTMERGLFALMAAKPGIALATGAGAIGAQPFYQTQLGRMAARKILETPGAVLRKAAAVPAIPGMAGGLLAGPQE